MDVSGQQQTDVIHDIFKVRLLLVLLSAVCCSAPLLPPCPLLALLPLCPLLPACAAPPLT